MMSFKKQLFNSVEKIIDFVKIMKDNKVRELHLKEGKLEIDILFTQEKTKKTDLHHDFDAELENILHPEEYIKKIENGEYVSENRH